MNDERPLDLIADGERFIPDQYENPQMVIEHYQRYYNATNYCVGKVVLDIASGEGYGSAILAGVAKSVTGVDIDAAAVEHASRKYKRENLHYAQGSVDAIPVDDGTVDVVVSFETIEHVSAAQQSVMMAEIKRVLAPGGLLFMSSPNKRAYTDTRGETNHFHIHELYQDEFASLVRSNFKNVRIGDQKYLLGSLLMWDSVQTEAFSLADRDRKSRLPDPLYCVVIASDGPLPEPVNSIFEAENFLDAERALHDTQSLLMKTQGALEDTQVALRDNIAQLDGSRAECNEIRAALMKTQHALESARGTWLATDNELQDAKMALAERREESTVQSCRFMRRSLKQRVAERIWSSGVKFLLGRFLGVNYSSALLPPLRPAELPRVEDLVPVPAVDGQEPMAQISYDAWYEDDEDYSAKADGLDIKAIAFYLPQFHRFKENDAWWGEGFTEWTNTSKSVPRFPSHYQPREPHDDIGYYDLSDWRTIERQAKLARRHGIYGFCFYSYWFSGKKLMEKPIDLIMEHPEIDIKFCLCWANENWTRRWDGNDAEILVGQDYADDSVQYIADMAKYMRDPRYIRVNGRPVMMVYRADLLPDASRTFLRWREWAKANGLGEIEIWVQRGCAEIGVSRLVAGADAEVEFPPGGTANFDSYDPTSIGMPTGEGFLLGYRRLVNNVLAGRSTIYGFSHKCYRGVMLGWDNACRRDTGFCTWWGFSLVDYYRWLRHLVDDARKRHPAEERFVFINAWNEWAEGTYLEPDRRFGYSNINVTSRALLGLPIEPKRISTATARTNVQEALCAMNLYQRGLPLYPYGLYWMYHEMEHHVPCIAWQQANGNPNALSELEELSQRFNGDENRAFERFGIKQLAIDRMSPPKKILKRSVAIHLHLFYPDMLPFVCTYLRNVPLAFDLFVSVPEGVRVLAEEMAGIRAQLPNLGQLIIRRTPNRGRDIAPLVCTFGEELAKYDYIAHFHTKKSLHTPSHNVWAAFIFNHLLGTDGKVERIFGLLQNGFGVVVPPDFMMMPEDPSGWGSNLGLAQSIVDRAGLAINLAKEFPVIEFPQGSMFWAKSGYMKKLLRLGISYDDFPVEPVGTDGTLAHALERMFFIWGLGRGENVAQIYLPGEENFPTRRRSFIHHD